VTVASLAWLLTSAGAHDEALSLLGLTLAAADATLDTLSYHALLAVFQTASACGRPDVAKRAHERLRQDLQSLEDARVLGHTLTSFLLITVLPYYADDLAYREEIAGAAEQAWARAQTLHLGASLPERVLRFPLDFIEGAWDAVRTALPIAQRYGGGTKRRCEMTLAMIARLQGRPDEAWRHIRDWLPTAPAVEPGTYSLLDGLWLLHLGGLLALDAGDLAAARQWAEAYDRWLAWSGAVQGRSEGRALWAHYYRQGGDVESARVHATNPRQPLALLAAHRLLGELHTEMGEHEAAAAHLAATLALADACAAPYERALALLALAALRAARGSIEEARDPLGEAHATFKRLDALPALTRADALAARLDATAHQPPVYPAHLSAREVEVLRLLAVGRTNREIADALFLSENTVRVHVRNIMTKTDTENRTAAAAFARDHRLA
jgi:DNA-binding CsgD family transcriptional regulator